MERVNKCIFKKVARWQDIKGLAGLKQVGLYSLSKRGRERGKVLLFANV